MISKHDRSTPDQEPINVTVCESKLHITLQDLQQANTASNIAVPSTSGSLRLKVEKFLTSLIKRSRPSIQLTQRRLMFAMDATSSREPTWQRACAIQAKMLQTITSNTLGVQLIYFRGMTDWQVSSWITDFTMVRGYMDDVRCMPGPTQIARVLRHALKITKHHKINTLVYIGDCVEENGNYLCDLAARFGFLGGPIFVFQEGQDAHAQKIFHDIARVSGGAYAQFDPLSPWYLYQLIKAVNVYAVGGIEALQNHKADPTMKYLTHQMTATL